MLEYLVGKEAKADYCKRIGKALISERVSIDFHRQNGRGNLV